MYGTCPVHGPLPVHVPSYLAWALYTGRRIPSPEYFFSLDCRAIWGYLTICFYLVLSPGYLVICCKFLNVTSARLLRARCLRFC